MIDFRRLRVWVKAHALTLAVYRGTDRLRRIDPALAAHTRRTAGSVSTNIVEGSGSSSQAEFARFLRISRTSAAELQYQLLLARDLGFLVARDYKPLEAATIEVKRMLTGMIKAVDATGKRQRESRKPNIRGQKPPPSRS